MPRTTWLLIGLVLCVAGCRSPRGQTHADALPGRDVEFGQAAEPESSVAASLAAGESALRAGRLAEARRHLDAVVEQSPNDGRAHHLAAVVADLEQRFDDAERHYHAALKTDPANADILGDLGYSYYLQQRDDLAQQYLTQALAIDSGHSTAKKNLALVAARQGDAAEARELLADVMPAGDVDQLLGQLAPPTQSQPLPTATPTTETPPWAFAAESTPANASTIQPTTAMATPNHTPPFGILEASHQEITDVAPAQPEPSPQADTATRIAAAPPANPEPAPRSPDPLAAREWPPMSWPTAETAPAPMQLAPAVEAPQQTNVRVADDPWNKKNATRDTALDPLQSYHEYRRRNDPEYARLTERP